MKIILAVTVASSSLAALVADSLPEVTIAPATPDIIIVSPATVAPRKVPKPPLTPVCEAYKFAAIAPPTK